MTRRGKYAEGTSVPEDRSRAELQKEIARFGASHFVIGESPTGIAIGFQVTPKNGPMRRVRFDLALPVRLDVMYSGTKAVSDRNTERRRRWRCLVLLVKAKLTAVEDGIATFDEEWMPHIVLPSGRTIGETVLAGLDDAIAGAPLPALMPGLDA